MSEKDARQIISRRLDDLFDILDLEIVNCDLHPEDVRLALEHYGLADQWAAGESVEE